MDNGGYAFPVPMVARPCGDGTTIVESAYDGGMTLRDYFAAAAMQGMVTGVCGSLSGEFSSYAKGPCNAEIADRAYVLADTMLRERDKIWTAEKSTTSG